MVKGDVNEIYETYGGGLLNEKNKQYVATKLYYMANGSLGKTEASNEVDSHVYKDKILFFCTFCFTVFFLFPSQQVK